MTPLSITGRRLLVQQGFLRLVEKQVSDGHAVESRVVVEHPGAVVLVPLVAGDHVVMVRQFRASVERVVLELPAGKRDVPGESAIATARRELAEECGLSARSFVEIGRFLNSPGFTNEETVVVLASGLELSANAPQSLEESAMEIVRVPLEPFSGLEDGKSLVGLEMVRRYLATHPEACAPVDDPAVTARFALSPPG